LFGGRTRFDLADYDLLRVIDVGLKAVQDRGRRNQQRCGEVEDGAGEGDEEALPFRM
jgi:hypothetical protein